MATQARLLRATSGFIQIGLMAALLIMWKQYGVPFATAFERCFIAGVLVYVTLGTATSILLALARLQPMQLLLRQLLAVVSILYDAFHFIWPARPDEQYVPEQRDADIIPEDGETVDVVGPICESGDFLATDRPLPLTKRGDLLAVFTTGAYGFAMSSNYNNRPRAPEVLVDGARYRVIRRRATCEDLVSAERV